MIGSRILAALAVALALTPLTGCGGGEDDGDGDKPKAAKPVDGTFVGKVGGTEAFVAVVASPVDKRKKKQTVTVYVSDGERLSEWFPGAAKGNSFSAASDDDDAQVKGTLSAKEAKGTVKLPDGKTFDYKAAPAAGAAGLYELTVSSKGRLTGASAAGIGLRGRTELTAGTGTLKLADGRRRKFDVEEDAEGEAKTLRGGQVRVIVLGDGQLRGAGKLRPTGDTGDAGFFIRTWS